MGFQQRVAAFALANVLAGDRSLRSLELHPDFDFCELRMEAALAIDDIVIVGECHRALIQAKTSVSLSGSDGSVYADVLRQFVGHHLRNSQEGDSYILATSIGSSKKIVDALRHLTHSTRLNARALNDDPHTETQKEVLEKTRGLILGFLRDGGVGAPTNDDFLNVFRRIQVLALDLKADGGRDLNAALMALKQKAAIECSLLWPALLQLCGALAEKRGAIDKVGLTDRFGLYMKREPQVPTQAEEAAFQPVAPEDPSAGTDVVMFYAPGSENDAVLLAATDRFNKDGSRATVFTRDGFKYQDSTVQSVLCRAATPIGVARYLAENPQLLGDRKLAVLTNVLNRSAESRPFVDAHKQSLKRMLQESSTQLRCVVCGDPVSENKAYVVEVDVEGVAPAAGLAHRRCQYPGLRLLGELESPLFDHYEVLRDFDFNKWIAVHRKNGASVLALNEPAVRKMVRPPTPVGHPRGEWCVRIDTKGGGPSHYVTNRAKVLRLDLVGARDEVAAQEEKLSNLAEKGDPWCITEDRIHAGRKSGLRRRLPAGTKVLECVGATAVRFTREIDELYSNPAEYYAPLALLVTPERGDPFELAKSVVLLTDPFKILDFMENWREAGYAIASIGAEVIETDQRFDICVSEALHRGRRVLVDPLFVPDGTLMRAFDIIEKMPDV